MSLKEYRRKRDFKKTAEPAGTRGQTSHYRFVIQKHAASHLHYDFRLELDGTLKSWAVPKGVPFKKGEKRLAVQVEDHPVSYANFEGTIPQGQYGGGTVMVWDYGTYEPLSDSPVKELEGGKLHFVLHGKKLEGEWYLVQLRKGTQWLLIRGGNNLPRVSKKLDDTSALSGKSMKQLSVSKNVWQSKHAEAEKSAAKPKPTRKVSKATRAQVLPRARGAIRPAFVEPMKARLADTPPAGDWIYEIKLDGFRALALKDGDHVSLLSRNEKSFDDKFPEVFTAVKEWDIPSAIVDGEIVALDEKGRSSFQLLQAYELGETRPPVFFYVFDLLQLDGRDLRGEPLTARKTLLEGLLKNAPDIIRYSASLEGAPGKLLQQAAKLGLEGLIAKQKNSTYENGRRSGSWVKLKLHQEQEVVIGGYTEPQGNRAHFGSLLMGYHTKEGLRFAGKVGTGFDEKLLSALHHRLDALSQKNCPFFNLPETKEQRYGQGVTASEMKKCHWVKPKLIGQIKFSEWTRDGKMRQPVFLGLRDDKDPREVVREIPK